MSIALRPSEITLPPSQPEWPTVLAFLISHFHRIAPEIWQQRILQGKVHWFAGDAISMDTPYQAGKRLCYYREVAQEPTIEAQHHILFQNEHIIVACKPHGLSVIPGGEFVNECLLERVRRDTKLQDIVPVHRLDRDTAGLVLFSCNSESRPHYYQLFAEGQITKHYRAVAQISDDFAIGQQWQVRNRIEKGTPRFIMQVVDGIANSHSTLQLSAITQTPQRQQLGLFALTPHTGKTHQLRVHMAGIGAPLLGDNYYPILLPKPAEIAPSLPLQLLAQRLSFIDPLTEQAQEFVSARQLVSWQGDWC